MVVDRIERHDVINAIMLAGVLLLFGFGIMTAIDSFFATADEGFVEAVKEEETLGSDQLQASATSAPEAETETTPDETDDILDPRPPGEVTVRVGNGARRPGVAGAGTDVLSGAGYVTLSPKNGPTLDDSVVYYATGYAADAARVAELLGLEATMIEPMPSDPGVPIDEAQLIAILGVSSNF